MGHLPFFFRVEQDINNKKKINSCFHFSNTTVLFIARVACHRSPVPIKKYFQSAAAGAVTEKPCIQSTDPTKLIPSSSSAVGLGPPPTVATLHPIAVANATNTHSSLDISLERQREAKQQTALNCVKNWRQAVAPATTLCQSI